MSRFARLLLPFAALVVAASCSDTEVFVPRVSNTNFAASLGVDLPNSVRSSSGLYYRDVTVGGGTLVPDDTVKKVSITYTGNLRNAKEFDDGNLTFDTNAANIIAGMKEGVRGMRIGGTRQLIIPPSLGYGNSGAVGIPANSILVFRVTLLNVAAP